MSVFVLSQSTAPTGAGLTTVAVEMSPGAVTEGSSVGKRHPEPSEDLNFLFIPLAVLLTVMLLSVMVYLMARRRHKLFSKHTYVPSFTFESSDLEDDRDELETEHLLKGKLRLDDPCFTGNKEVFT